MKRFIRNIITRFLSVPLPVRIGAGVVLLILLYFWTFLVPTNVQLSYANKQTCVDWFMLAPEIQQQRAGKEQFTVTPTDVTSVFGAAIFSRTVCITPASAPKEGRVKASVAPLGLPIFSKTFGVNTAALPVAAIGSLKDAEVSAVRSLTIPLSDKDDIHTYTLKHDDKTASCKSCSFGMDKIITNS